MMVAGGLLLKVVEFGYRVWRDHRGDRGPKHTDGEPPAAAA